MWMESPWENSSMATHRSFYGLCSVSVCVIEQALYTSLKQQYSHSQTQPWDCFLDVRILILSGTFTIWNNKVSFSEKKSQVKKRKKEKSVVFQ